jgi:hypothetical protein
VWLRPVCGHGTTGTLFTLPGSNSKSNRGDCGGDGDEPEGTWYSEQTTVQPIKQGVEFPEGVTEFGIHSFRTGRPWGALGINGHPFCSVEAKNA